MSVVFRTVFGKPGARFYGLVSLICLLNSPVLGEDSQNLPDSPSVASQPTRESVIQELLQRHQAVEFEEPYRGEYSTTLALQDALIGEDGRPVLLKDWDLDDVGRKLGSGSSDYFMVFTNRWMVPSPWNETLDFILDCNAEHVKALNFVEGYESYAVLAKISSVRRWLYEAVVESENEGLFPDVKIRNSKDYIARGTCIEIVDLPPDLEAEKASQEAVEKTRKRRRSLREVISETFNDLYGWVLDHVGDEELKQR